MIVCMRMLHLMKYADGLKLVEEMKAHTSEGGLNVVHLITNEGDFSKVNDARGNFYPPAGYLKDAYSDWEIVIHQEAKLLAKVTGSDGSPMENMASVIIARKAF